MKSTQPQNGSTDISPVYPTMLQIFLAFLRLGITAFGGPAMVAYIGEMATTKRQWLSKESFKEGVAIAQTIPGAMAMQVAAYVGLRLRGISGALAAYVGFGLPGFVLMIILSVLYRYSLNSPVMTSVFQGLQIIVVAIIARAAFTFGRTIIKAWQDILIGLAAATYLVYGGNPILAIIAGAALGLFIFKEGTISNESDKTSPLRSTTRPVLLIILIAFIMLSGLYFLNRKLFDISFLMLKADTFAFGGGFASIPVLLHEVVEVRNWMSTRAFMDGIAMGQVTPGPIVVTATFVGYQVAGTAGALFATFYIYFPSFVFMTLVVPHFDRMKANPLFRKATRGILASFVGLLLAVTLRFGIAVPWTYISVFFVCGAFIALMLKVEVPWVIITGAIVSMIVFR